MKKMELKSIVSDHIIKLMSQWFEGLPLYQALGITIVQTNVNKFDGVIDMLTDENGDVNINQLIENLGDTIEQDMTIDLTKISPFLPKRVLLISKEDIRQLVEKLKGMN